MKNWKRNKKRFIPFWIITLNLWVIHSLTRPQNCMQFSKCENLLRFYGYMICEMSWIWLLIKIGIRRLLFRRLQQSSNNHSIVSSTTGNVQFIKTIYCHISLQVQGEKLADLSSNNNDTMSIALFDVFPTLLRQSYCSIAQQQRRVSPPSFIAFYARSNGIKNGFIRTIVSMYVCAITFSFDLCRWHWQPLLKKKVSFLTR